MNPPPPARGGRAVVAACRRPDLVEGRHHFEHAGDPPADRLPLLAENAELLRQRAAAVGVDLEPPRLVAQAVDLGARLGQPGACRVPLLAQRVDRFGGPLDALLELVELIEVQNHLLRLHRCLPFTFLVQRGRVPGRFRLRTSPDPATAARDVRRGPPRWHPAPPAPPPPPASARGAERPPGARCCTCPSPGPHRGTGRTPRPPRSAGETRSG